MLGDLLLDHATLTTFVLENLALPRGPADRTVKLKNEQKNNNKKKVKLEKGIWVRETSSPGQPKTLSISTLLTRLGEARTGSIL